jgi:hypothetical protein
MKTMKKIRMARSASAGLAAAMMLLGGTADGALYFWDNGGGTGLFSNPANWSPDGIPGPADLAVHNDHTLPAVTIDGNWGVDSFRISDGGSVSHTAGTLTIEHGVGPDNGLWLGEFGPREVSYTLNGGTLQINDPADGFMIGRGSGSVGTFDFLSGTVNATLGDTHIGLDGTATWNQSGGVFNGAGVQIGRFASPLATVNLSGDAAWNVGLVLLADGHGVFDPRNPGPVNLNITGPNVSFTSTGLVLMQEANLTFDGTGGGLSTLGLAGGQFLLSNGELFLNSLPSAMTLGQEIVLINDIGSYTGPDTEFDNAPEGTIFGDWMLTYRPDQIALVSIVPEPSTLSLAALGLLALAAWRKRAR